jgi:hypothetical protein
MTASFFHASKEQDPHGDASGWHVFINWLDYDQ